ncbi:uncharacterized protein LOC123517304 isoform X2 [Portunus trituberculatus]|uniref:uncharacterized protein LOC123517304 isoform X2 n=1 Tax=Portunus trituberculatus TaxID=210409 RepID=UPI001E1D19EA|nr:uncharacterized protein LOC123517304 isoform X2 [Portunus trituberculatus]
MTSRRKSETPRSSRSSLRLRNISASQGSAHTTKEETPKQVEKTATENQTPAQQTSRYGRIKSTLKSSRIKSMIVKTPSKTRQATSYRTPRLKTVPWLRVSGQTSAKKRDAKMWSEDLNGLMRRSLKLCNLSSMTNFKFKDEKLRAQYQKALKSKVLDAYPSPLVKVKLNVTSCLSWQSSIVDAVWLEVSSLIPGETEAEDKMVVVYSAWVIHTKHIQSSNLKNVNWLPLMLYTGRELIHQVVVNWLQGSFGCYVARSGMPQNNLLWLTGICTRMRCRNSAHNIEDAKISFNYLIVPPCGMSSFSLPNNKGKPRVTITLSLKDVVEVWNRFLDKDRNEISLEDLQNVISTIDSVTSSTFGIPSSLLRLQQVRTPCIVLNNNGKIHRL